MKACKPFLRWAGGKTWLIKHVSKYLPEGKYSNYHEPFLGGGAMFFHIKPQKAFISDLNHELVFTYDQIRENVEEVIANLRTYSNTAEFYYGLRSYEPKSAAEKASRFIYLNQTSFNGIYRVNLKGEYNVPYGHRKKNFLDEENLRLVSTTLQNTNIFCGDFEETLPNIRENDLVFLDPPYTVTHNNNGFIRYNSKLFGEESQERLARFIDKIDELGAYYILTNAAHEWVKGKFKTDSNDIITLSRMSRVGGVLAKRGRYDEFLITNTIKKSNGISKATSD